MTEKKAPKKTTRKASAKAPAKAPKKAASRSESPKRPAKKSTMPGPEAETAVADAPWDPAEHTAPEGAAPLDGHAPVGRPSATDEGPGEPTEAESLARASSPERLALLKELPFLDPHYNETYVYLVPRDPASLYVLWEVGEGSRKHFEGIFGPDFLRENFLVLRVYDVTGVDFNGYNALSSFEVDDFLNDKSSYWVGVAPGRHYVAELGFRAKGTTYFEKVARSNTAFVPRGVEEPAERYVAWGDVNVSGNFVEVPVGPDQWRLNQYHYWRKRTHAAAEEKGYWSLVLHQHLPFVRHPEHEVSLEEQWFFEAVVSVYTQLIHMMWRLERDKVDFRLTVSLTPPLLAMMQDPHLKDRTARHIRELLALATRERDRASGGPHQDALDEVLRRLWAAREVFDAYDGDVTKGYRAFQDLGKLEVITCAATHWLLPLHVHQPESVRAQLRLAVRQYERAFGRPPRGIWLPENAFTPGLDERLAEAGLRWTLVTTKGLKEGDTRPFYGGAAPVVTPAGVAVFPIDEETRYRIWSREHGFPGAPNYKEWYRDLGYDLPWEELPDYWKTAGVRRNTGIKLHRIGTKGTGLGSKPPYVPSWARETLEAQAGQFVFERGAQANYYRGLDGGHKPCIVSAYDAELFGHWWEEGPDFVESVFRRLLYDQSEVRPVTPAEYLAENPHHQRMVPGASSWGREDYFQTWVEDRAYQPNAWVYRHLFRLSQKMSELATRFRDTEDTLRRRALNQAARCLVLAGASDWGFLISTGQAVRYSEVQVTTHLDRARELLRQAESGHVELSYLEPIEAADTIFAWNEMDFRVFAKG